MDEQRSDGESHQDPQAVAQVQTVDRPHPPFMGYALRFFRGATARTAWLLAGGSAATVGVGVAVSYGVNKWQGAFFNALENKRIEGITQSLVLLAALIAGGIVVQFVTTRLRQGLQIEWRRWMTGTLGHLWLDDRNYYKLNVSDGDHDNPEARMTEDVRLALEPVVDLSIGFLNAILSAATFIGVLAWVGGATKFELFGHAFDIPYGFVVIAILYAALMSGLTYLLGNKLIATVEEKNGADADLRYSMTRIRESAESIALIAGEDEERRNLQTALSRLMSGWHGISWIHARLNGLFWANGLLTGLVALIVGAPKYVAGDMTLGQLMQVSAAFVQVQMALNWMMDNFIRLAEWRASANRVMGVVGSIEAMNETLNGADGSKITLAPSSGDELHLENVSVRRNDGVIVIDMADGVIKRGERVMISGESGTGKSTLIRAIAGLWPWGEGEIAVPKGWRVMFLPQTAYLPEGTLKDALSYPQPADGLSDASALALLDRIGLGHLGARLNDSDRWDRVLSGGERQRIAFARILLTKPDLVVMDEATAALDEDSQTRVMTALMEDLPEATLISVAHRPSLEQFHTRRVELKRAGGEVRLVRSAPRETSGRVRGERLRRALRRIGQVKTASQTLPGAV